MPTFDFAGLSLLDRPAGDLVGTVPAVTAQARNAGGHFRRDVNLVQLHDELWRVTRADGDVLGYVESFMDPRGRRFRTKRLIALQKRFIPLGEFWSFDDAIDCLRFG